MMCKKNSSTLYALILWSGMLLASSHVGAQTTNTYRIEVTNTSTNQKDTCYIPNSSTPDIRAFLASNPSVRRVDVHSYAPYLVSPQVLVDVPQLSNYTLRNTNGTVVHCYTKIETAASNRTWYEAAILDRIQYFIDRRPNGYKSVNFKFGPADGTYSIDESSLCKQ